MIILFLTATYFAIAALLFLMMYDMSLEATTEEMLNDLIAAIAWPVTLLFCIIDRKN